MKLLRLISITSVCAVMFMMGIALPSNASAAEKCDFSRDLDIGAEGEDVRCLQKYLNANGYTIAASGVGSPGNETNLFRELTQKAISVWQLANGISPSNGYFGPISQKKYNELVNLSSPVVGNPAPSTTTVVNTNPSSSSEIESILAKIGVIPGGNSNPTTNVNSEKDKNVRSLIKKAIKQLDTADEEIDDAEDEGLNVDSALIELEDAQEDLLEAVLSYFDEKYDSALASAQNAYDNAVDAFQEAGGETEEDEVDDLLGELEDEIDETWEEIKIAEDDDQNVEEAEDLLEEAEDVLEQAEDALDNDDVDEAKDLAEEVEDLIDEAIDAIGSDEEDDAEEMFEDAQDALSDAWDEVQEAEEDGDDVDEAEDLLNEAEDLLDEAEDALDDKDFDDVEDLVEEAEDLIDEALDEI